MNNNARQLELIAHAETKQGSEVVYRHDWECYYFSLLGKCFGMLNDDIITLKGEPDQNVMLRETYIDVQPGYYTNKIHWNTIPLTTKQITTEQLKHFIDTSYELVKQKLTKKEKEQLFK